MSLFNFNSPNALELRAHDIKADNIYQWNETSQEYVRIDDGGDGDSVPYWAQPEKAHIIDNFTHDSAKHDKLGYIVETTTDGTRQKANLTKESLTIDDEATSTGSLLTSTELVFGDAVDNSSFTKVGAKTLNEITARVDKPDPISTDKLLIYDSTNSMYKTTSWKDYLKSNHAEFIGTFYNAKVSGDKVSVFSKDAGTVSSVSAGAVQVASKISAVDSSPDYNKPYTALFNFAIQCKAGSTYASTEISPGTIALRQPDYTQFKLDTTHFADLMKLTAKTLMTTPTTDEKMVLYNTTTKAYHYTTIPGEPILPPYILPSSIEFIGTDTSVNIDDDGVKIFGNAPTAALAKYSQSSFKIGSKTLTPGAIDSAQPNLFATEIGYSALMGVPGSYSTLQAGGVDIFVGNVGRSLSWNNLGDLINFYSKTSTATATASERMILFNPSSGVYRYTPIPAAVATPTFYQVNLNSFDLHNAAGDPLGTWSYANALGNTLTYAEHPGSFYQTSNTVKSGDVVRITVDGNKLSGCKTGRTFNIPIQINGLVNGSYVTNVSTNNHQVTALLIPVSSTNSTASPTQLQTNSQVLRFTVNAEANLVILDISFSIHIINAGTAFTAD